MKRSHLLYMIESAIKKYYAYDQTVEECAEAILNICQREGMLPPYSKQADLGCECGCKGQNERGHAWDSE